VRRDTNTDTPLPPEEPAGQNPPDGAIINYYLADNAPGLVTLEILSPSGRSVRRFSSDDRPEPIDETKVNVPLYWLRPPQPLLATKGMHRFIWDLRQAPPQAIERDYPISAVYKATPLEPLGVLVVPGTYMVKLTIDGRTFTAPLTVKLDPRVKMTPIGLREQYTAASRLVDAMNRSYAAWQRAKGTPAESDLAKLNADAATVYDVVEGADAAPTAVAMRAVADLEKRVATLAR